MTIEQRLRELASKATPIPCMDGYAITPDGRVFSLRGWRAHPGPRELAQQERVGYRVVRLGSARRKIGVHVLLAMTFGGPRPTPSHEVRHLNGDRYDNRAENIAWGTRSENAIDRQSHGRTARGPLNGAAKLSVEQVRSVRVLYRSGLTQRKVAGMFGVSDVTVSNIVRGKWWSHVED